MLRASKAPQQQDSADIHLAQCMCRFEALPSSERTVLQLCDLEDEEIQSLLRAQPAAETADATSGEPAVTSHSSSLLR